MARKRKEFYKLTPKVLKKVERLASKGCYVKDICVSIGWSKDYFYKSLKKSTDLDDSLKKGQSKRVVTLISKLAKKADGYNYKEKHIEDIIDKETGLILTQKVKVIIKHMPPDVAALIFSLINLDGANWSNKQELAHKGDIIIKADKDDEKL